MLGCAILGKSSRRPGHIQKTEGPLAALRAEIMSSDLHLGILTAHVEGIGCVGVESLESRNASSGRYLIEKPNAIVAVTCHQLPLFWNFDATSPVNIPFHATASTSLCARQFHNGVLKVTDNGPVVVTAASIADIRPQVRLSCTPIPQPQVGAMHTELRVEEYLGGGHSNDRWS